MGKIKFQKPYVYLAKTSADYYVSIAIQIADNQTLSGTRSGRIVTLTITTNNNTARSNVLAGWTGTFAIPNPAYNDTDELEVNITGATADYSFIKFGDADVLTTVPASTDPLPHLLAPKSNSGSFTPRMLIYPTNGHELVTETVKRTKDGEVSIDVEIQTGSAIIDNNELITNDIFEVKDPNPKDATTAQINNGGSKKKAKVSHQS